MSEATSVRESIEAAIDTPAPADALSDGGVVHGVPPGGAPATAAAAAAPASPAGGEPAPAGAPDAPAPRAPAGPTTERNPFATDPAKQQLQLEPPAAPPELKAPASWKADLRERWKTIPPEVQGEIIRRERENDTRMQSHAETRKFADRFESIVSPYRAFIESEGAEPLTAFHDYLKTATMLRTGQPNDKARLVAQLVSQYGVPLQALDHYLAQSIQGGGYGPQQAPQQPAQQQQFHDPRLDQLLSRIQANEQQTLTQDIDKFSASPENEFFEDVRLTMADVMDAAAKRGITMSLADAYTRACQIEPEVKKVLDQRATRGSVNQAARTLAAARHAASSVPSQRAPPAPKAAGTGAPGSVRDAILNSIDNLSGTA